jgi:hypothetical protein
VKAKADEIGITGYIRLLARNDLYSEFEGTCEQIREYFAFLNDCQARRMFRDFDRGRQITSTSRRFPDFTTDADTSDTATCRDGLILNALATSWAVNRSGRHLDEDGAQHGGGDIRRERVDLNIEWI